MFLHQLLLVFMKKQHYCNKATLNNKIEIESNKIKWYWLVDEDKQSVCLQWSSVLCYVNIRISLLSFTVDLLTEAVQITKAHQSFQHTTGSSNSHILDHSAVYMC